MCPSPTPSRLQPLPCCFEISGLFFCPCSLGRKGVKLLAWVQLGEGRGCWPVSLCRGSFPPPVPPNPCPVYPSFFSCFLWRKLREDRQRESVGEAPKASGGYRNMALGPKGREPPHTLAGGCCVSKSDIQTHNFPTQFSEVPLFGKLFLSPLSPPSPDPHFHPSWSWSLGSTSRPQEQERWGEGSAQTPRTISRGSSAMSVPVSRNF